MMTLANQIMNVPNKTHWGESISNGPLTSSSSLPSSGNMGESFRTIVSMLIVDTVTSRRKAVSSRVHFRIGSQFSMLNPNGSRIAALPQSTTPWWNSSPCDQLDGEEIKIKQKYYILRCSKEKLFENCFYRLYEFFNNLISVYIQTSSKKKKNVAKIPPDSYGQNFIEIDQ